MTIIIDFEEARRRLQPQPLESHARTIYECTLDDRLYAEHLPFVSGLPTHFLEGRWP
jgi:hypothetical protein